MIKNVCNKHIIDVTPDKGRRFFNFLFLLNGKGCNTDSERQLFKSIDFFFIFKVCDVSGLLRNSCIVEDVFFNPNLLDHLSGSSLLLIFSLSLLKLN